MKREFSIQELSLKRRIWIAVSLVTLIPLIIFLYYLNGLYISLPTVIVALFIVFLGWWIIFEVFASIARVYHNSKKTLKNIGEETPAVANEVQSLESVIDILSSKMRSGLEQLKDFSKKTEELNQEVSKKVFVLSTILQANDLFSKDIPTEEVIAFLIQRIKETLGIKICFFASKDEKSDKFHIVSCLGSEIEKVERALLAEGKYISKLQEFVVCDKTSKISFCANIIKELGVNNLGISPIISKEQLAGVLAIGSSSDNFTFNKDDLDIINIFSQNIALILEHKRLSVKVNELEVFDYLTGLYNFKYIEKRLDEEIVRSTSYQRPCGFLLVEISNYADYQEKFGPIEAEKLVKKTAKIFKETLRMIDITGRVEQNSLCAILIEKNKRQSLVIARELKNKLENAFKDQLKITFSLAENPIDGTTSSELIAFAKTHINATETNEIS